MMSKLLTELSRVWNTLPKDIPVVTLEQGNGEHSLVTITSDEIVFHSTPFRSDMINKQSLAVDDCTLEDLVQSISAMGYTASLTDIAVNRGFGSRGATTLMLTENLALYLPVELTAFTSNLWQTLYPIARLLKDLDEDTDSFAQQLFIAATSGKWLDYWATFFNLKRFQGEADYLFRKRVFMSLVNMKTNNVALQELLSYATGGTATLVDVSAALFEVLINPTNMETAALVHQIIKDAKGGGIDYFLNYKGYYDEQYTAYFMDTYGIDFAKSDVVKVIAESYQVELVPYGYTYERFKTNSTKIITDGVKIVPKRLGDRLSVSVDITNSESFTKPSEALEVSIQLSEQPYPTPVEALVSRQVSMTEQYTDPVIKGLWGFRLNSSRFYSAADSTAKARLSIIDNRVQESLSMTLTVAGVTVKSM